MGAVGRAGRSLSKWGWSTVLSGVTPGCPLGSVNRPGAAGGPSARLCSARLQPAAADLVIMLLKRTSRWPQ